MYFSSIPDFQSSSMPGSRGRIAQCLGINVMKTSYTTLGESLEIRLWVSLMRLPFFSSTSPSVADGFSQAARTSVMRCIRAFIWATLRSCQAC